MSVHLYTYVCVDLPGILSGDMVAFIDPHEKYFKYRGHYTSSYSWSLKSGQDRSDIKTLRDQFAPFLQELFGATDQAIKDGFFRGTIFRFPLRVKAARSKICKREYTADHVKMLFRSIEADADLLLLFLKNIEQIELYEKNAVGITPNKIMSIRVSSSFVDQVRVDRSNLVQRIRSRAMKQVASEFSIAYAMRTERENIRDNNATETRSWIVSHYYASDEEMDSSQITDDVNDNRLPCVAVAFPLQPPDDQAPHGQLFSFLPLPIETQSPTGFRFHVHGDFALEQNRRHVKKRSGDDGNTDNSIMWNEFLIGKLLPKAIEHCAIFTTLSGEIEHNNQIVYSIIPNKNFVKEQWISASDTFLNQLPQLGLFYSTAMGGRYLTAEDALFDSTEDVSSLTVLLRRILYSNETDLVSVPMFVLEQLGQAAKQPTALDICNALKNVQTSIELSDADRIALLTYIVDNVQDLSQIIGLQLLPLATGSWIEFKCRTTSEKIYVESDDHSRSLLPGLDHLFVRADAVDTCRTIARKGELGYSIKLIRVH